MQVTSKGQVTIPLELREKFGITGESEVDFFEEKNRIYLVKRTATKKTGNRLEQLRGITRSGMSTDEIMKLTRERS